MCRRAVVVGKALDTPAALNGRVTGSVSAGSRARAFGHVIISHADGPGATAKRSAGCNASPRSGGVRSADGVIRTLGVSLALLLRDGSAAVAVVGIAREASTADALADVVSGAAVGVGRARKSSTDGRALAHAQHVRFTNGIGSAVSVGHAVRNCCQK